MKYKRFLGNKPPPMTAGIPYFKQIQKLKPQAQERVYSNKTWRNRCLKKHVQQNSEGEFWTCYLCGIFLTIKTVTVDHVIPKAKGGGNNPGNLRPCCTTCNSNKRDTIPEPPSATPRVQ